MVKECFFIPFEGKDTELVRKGIFSFINDFRYQKGWLAVNVIEIIQALSEYPGLNVFDKLRDEKEVKINNFIFRRVVYRSILSNGRSRKNSLPKNGRGTSPFSIPSKI